MTESIERCGWNVRRSTSHALNPDGPDLIRVGNGELGFYLPADLYDDLSDDDFVALCEAKRLHIESRPR